MRTRLRRKLLIKKTIIALFLAAAIPASAGLLLWSLPSITGYVAKAGLISAGLALPEGGLALLEGLASQKDEETLASLASSETTLENSESKSESTVVSAPESSQTDQSDEPSSSEPEGSEPPAEPVPDPVIPEENKAVLLHKNYQTAPSNIYIPLENGYIKNCTKVSRDDILSQVKNPPYFTVEDTKEPQVLIMHTHTTESYMPFSGDYYDKTTSFRTTDNRKNMAAVGDEIVRELESAGIGVIHDVTQHDYPSYNGSYDRSRVTVQDYLKKYPSIKVVLDIHRDAIVSGDTVTAPVAEVDGKTAAQVMIISGCENGTMNYPDYMKNLSFSASLQNQMESDYPTFTRPILFDYRFYNQNLTTGSILIEVGGHGNTLEQAVYSGELIGKSLGKLLNSMK